MKKQASSNQTRPSSLVKRKLKLNHYLFKKSRENKSKIYFADENFIVSNHRQIGYLQVKKENEIYFKKLNPQLKGIYQTKNIATVLQAIELSNNLGYKITKRQAQLAIQKVVDTTGLLGRWQVLQNIPLCVADTGHNEAGIKMVLKQIKQTPHQAITFCFRDG
jgi:dihydrofolate synthase/folylpolyglutamate synthase